MRLALLTCAALLSLACSDPPPSNGDRSVLPISQQSLVSPRPERFDPRKSAALFVGVRTFSRGVEEVPYAVDDAVDLAYQFALERKSKLVMPRRTALVLSGFPKKPESEKRLTALKNAGAVIVRDANQADILSMLQRQAALADAGGILIVSIASHGFSKDGTAYILGASSVFPDHGSALSTSTIADIAARSKTRRSLLFIDACRERVQTDSRSLGADIRSMAPLISRMSKVEGQVVFYAAAPGQYAYDNHEKMNGVFTDAVLEGLRCHTARDANGLVTVKSLGESVERDVLAWIRKHRDKSARTAIQVNFEGNADQMPLAMCDRPPGPEYAVKSDRIVTAFDAGDRPLWSCTLDGTATQAEAVDLDGDTDKEVVVAVNNQVVAYDADGELLWSVDTGRMPVTRFISGELFGKGERSVIAVAEGHGKSRVSIIAPDGVERVAKPIHGDVQQIALGRPTSHHAPRILITALTRAADVEDLVSSVFLLNRHGKREWQGAVLPSGNLDLEVIDFDNDGVRDIALRTNKGPVYVSFDGIVHKLAETKFIRVK